MLEKFGSYRIDFSVNGVSAMTPPYTSVTELKEAIDRLEDADDVTVQTVTVAERNHPIGQGKSFDIDDLRSPEI